MGCLDIVPEIKKHGVRVNEGVEVENDSDCLRKMKEMYDTQYSFLAYYKINKRGGDGASE